MGYKTTLFCSASLKLPSFLQDEPEGHKYLLSLSKSGQENFPINFLHLISSSSSAQTAYESIS